MGRYIFYEGNSFFTYTSSSVKQCFGAAQYIGILWVVPLPLILLKDCIFSFADSEQSLRSASVNGAPDFMAFKTILVGITPCITQGTISPKSLAKGFQKPLSTG